MHKLPSRLGFVLRALALSAPMLGTPHIGLAQATAPSFVAFESGHVRPLALSPDGSRLYAVNTPNNSLDVFRITPEGLSLLARVPVGLEPVAVAARGNGEVWVVNHLSDSVSVVSMEGTPRVVRTLLVGDEPRDIVFAGSPARAFITTAHRGQHRTDPSIAQVPGAGDPQLSTPGIGRADVWVFDPAKPGVAMGGVPLRIMSFFADTPRALAVSPDGRTVYVAAFKSGNQTSVVLEQAVCNGFKPAEPCTVGELTFPGGLPGPQTNFEGKPAPETGLIVKYNNGAKRWEDGLGRDWSSGISFTLPDRDVFAVDADALTEKKAYANVGTTLFNMAVNPVTGVLYVSNTEANNLARFEGPGTFAGSTLQGKLALARVTVVSPDGVRPRHLNKHIDYGKLAHKPGFDASVKQHSLSMPLGMAVTKDGKTLYVSAYGSSRIGVYGTAELESDSFDPRKVGAINLTGGGPSGIVLDEARSRMYVMTRFDNAVKVVDLAARTEIAAAPLVNPEPAEVVAGRPFLYDAQRSSSNGEASCASCHIFGDEDALAWDLGNPDDKVTTSPIPAKLATPIHIAAAKLIFGIKTKINGSDNAKHFHPMKGPMTTQTMRGMRNSGAMHWRGDRATGLFGTSAKDSTLSFINFAVAHEGLLGSGAPASEADMRAFAAFQLSVMLPPNPVRRLDNTLTAAQQRGKGFYSGKRTSDGIPLLGSGTGALQTSFTCEGCHTIDPAQGFFGTNGDQAFVGLTQVLKVPHLRNLYQRVGMFRAVDQGNEWGKEQVRGFGFTHDGAISTVFRFFSTPAFNNVLDVSGFPKGEEGVALRRDMEDLMMAFESDLAPIVGQQVTLSAANAALVGARIDLLIQRARAPFVSKELGGQTTECDLIATVVEAGVRQGYVYDTAGDVFVRGDRQQRNDAGLRALAKVPGQEITYTCAPPGSGRRMVAM